MGTGFWSMGGYARFVWPCFAFAGLVLAWNLWSARRHHIAARSRARRALAAAASEAASDVAAGVVGEQA
jgi:heme exporter protein CcmD